MRLLGTGFAFAAIVILGMAPAAGQDRGSGAKKKGQTNDCDMKHVEKGWWCEKDDELIEIADIDKKKKTHKKCGEKPIQVVICVKKYYCADCHPDKTSDKPVS